MNDYGRTLVSAKRAGKPTYFFEVGDKVKVGSLLDSVVDEVLDNGLCYRIKFREQDKKKYGEEETYREETRFFPWHNVRPLPLKLQSAFTSNEDIKLHYSNTDIRCLIYKHLLESGGIDFDPPYQREYVWTDKDRESLLDSIFMGADIGRFTVRSLDTLEYLERDLSYEIIDGKQRLLTILDFYENRFPYRGFYYNGLSQKDKNTFMSHNVSWAEVRNLSKEDTLRLFLMLNRGGHAVSDAVINKAEALLDAIRKDKENNTQT